VTFNESISPPGPPPSLRTEAGETGRAAPADDVPGDDSRRSWWPGSGRAVLASIKSVLMALILAFTFRAFLIEPFIIPTGSMAPTLLGAHGTLCCPACGLEFDYGPANTGAAPDAPFLTPREVECPACRSVTPMSPERAVLKAGDRILVHKWPFLLGGWLGPRRWDVVVFRDPTDPRQNYIKRVAALPGESIEIVDGDVYIDGRIARKTRVAQAVLWQPVFDQDRLPGGPPDPGRPRWRAEDQGLDPSAGWSGLDSRLLRYCAQDDLERFIFYHDADQRSLTDFATYNGAAAAGYVGDLRVTAELTPLYGDGFCRLELIRDGVVWSAVTARSGMVRLLLRPSGAPDEQLLGEWRGPALADRRPVGFGLQHLDQRVAVFLDGREVLATSDEQYAPDLEALRGLQRHVPVQVRIGASGWAVELRALRLQRDVYYTSHESSIRRAYPGAPFALGPDEYFALGDNSARSHDSREWARVGAHLQSAWEAGGYQMGAVRADQIVGQAFFVYLPGLQPLDVHGRWRTLDLGRMRFIR
jgi:signal peptidase I